MNIRTNDAGSVTHEHILSKGFTIYHTEEVWATGGHEADLPYFTNGEINITNGYWTYNIEDINGKVLWQGWWNSNEEFDQTIEEVLTQLSKQQ